MQWPAPLCSAALEYATVCELIGLPEYHVVLYCVRRKIVSDSEEISKT